MLVVGCWWWGVGGGVLVVGCWWWGVGGGVLVVEVSVVRGLGVVVARKKKVQNMKVIKNVAWKKRKKNKNEKLIKK